MNMNERKPFQQAAFMVMILALILYLPVEIFPGTTGKIAGRLVDAQTGDPLPGANVVVQGTTLGAATDIEGYYSILRMPPGTYILEITMIGYKKIIHTNVIVNVDLTTTQNFGLEATVIEGAEVTTTAERPLVIRDLTSSSSRVSAAEIEDIPNVNSVTDAIVLMPGVIGEGEEIHVRGGRSGEVVYLIDGIAVNDPLFNDEVIDVNKYAIDEVELLTGGYNAEYGNVQSGVVNIVPRTGGSKLSGRFAYFTDDFGGGKFPGDVLNDARSASDPLAMFLVDAQKTFKPEGTGLRSNSFNTDRWEFNLGGPLPVFGDKLSFFVSATAEMSDGFLPNEDQSADLLNYPELFDTSELVLEPGEADAVTFDLSNSRKVDHPFQSSFLGLFDFGGRFNNNVNYTGVLNFRPAPNYKAALTFVGSQFWQDDYRHLYKFQSDLTNQFEGTNSNTVFTWTHTVSPSTFYEAKFAYTRNNRLQYPGMRNGVRLTPLFQNSRITGLGPIDDDLLGEGDGGDTPFNESFLESYITSNPQLFPDTSAVIAFANAVAGFQRFGLDGSGTWAKHLSQVYTAKGDLVSQVTRNHQLKAGFEWRFNDLQQQRIDDGTNKVPSRRIDPPDDGPFITSGSLRDFYNREPNTGSLYIQDKIEFESLIVNLGLRFDHFDPGAQVFEINEAFQTDETEKEVVNDKDYLSPRIGISHPITDRSTLYFFYGRFVQIPEMSELYRRQNRFRIFQNQLNTFGNPDLQAEETISYEVGFDHQFTDDLKIGVTGFFKDKRNQINLETFGTVAAPFQKLVNRDFGSDRGFEIELIKRYSNHIAANINYTLMWATTRSSTFGRGIGAQGVQSFPNLKEVPADWDQRHTINGNISLEFPAGQGFKFLGTTIDRLGLNTFIRYGSGVPFTIDEDADAQALENSARLPYFLTVDLRLRKDFMIFRDFMATFYIDVNNLFNRRNLIDLVNDEAHRCVECLVPIRDAAGIVIGSEVKTFKNGNPEGDGGASDLNPEQFGAPRQILLGLGLRF